MLPPSVINFGFQAAIFTVPLAAIGGIGYGIYSAMTNAHALSNLVSSLAGICDGIPSLKALALGASLVGAGILIGNSMADTGEGKGA